MGGGGWTTTTDTLLRSDYLRSLTSGIWKADGLVGEMKTFQIDRCGGIFKHVLRLLRNPEYDYPEKYIDELTFYGIDHQKIGPTLEEKIDRCYSYISKLCCQTSGCTNDIIPYHTKCVGCSKFKPSKDQTLTIDDLIRVEGEKSIYYIKHINDHIDGLMCCYLLRYENDGRWSGGVVMSIRGDDNVNTDCDGGVVVCLDIAES